MPGKRKLHNIPHFACFLLALAAILLGPYAASANELRRSMPFLRTMLMGGAAVALGDESSAISYNPAGLARLKAGTIEAFSLQFAGDELVTAAASGEDVESGYDNYSALDLVTALGTSQHAQLALKIPMVFNRTASLAWGIVADSLVDIEVAQQGVDYGVLLEAYVDYQVLTSRFWSIGDSLFLGGTLRVINRTGVNKFIDVATLYSSGSFDLKSDSDVQAFYDGKSYTRAGLDLGLIFQWPGSTNWQPRFGLSVLNIGDYGKTDGLKGIEFGSRSGAGSPPRGGELPLNLAFGFAVSPTFGSVRFTFAVDVVDLWKTAMEGDSVTNRTRVGMEIGFGPGKDGAALFSFVFGWNATHFGGGFITRVMFFEIGMGSYTVERGIIPDERPQARRVLLIGFRF